MALFPGFEIGDCEAGIQTEKVRRFLEIQAARGEDLCQECWACRLCQQCPARIAESGELSKAAMLESCRRERERILWNLQQFVYLWENEPPSVWDHPHSLHYAARRQQQGEGADLESGPGCPPVVPREPDR
jgi:hypothetical protein